MSMMMKYRMAWLAIACLMALCHAATQENQKTSGKYKGIIEADAWLDEDTGRVTCLIRCTKDIIVVQSKRRPKGCQLPLKYFRRKIEVPTRIHMKSIEDAELMLRIEPTVDIRRGGTGSWKEVIDPREGFSSWKGEVLTSAGRPSSGKGPEPDRVVDLKKGEGLLKSFLIWDAPWWSRLVAKLKAGRVKGYRITFTPAIYTVDKAGKPVLDHTLSPQEMARGSDARYHRVSSTTSFVIDLELVRRLEALRAQARRSAHPRPTRPAWPRP